MSWLIPRASCRQCPLPSMNPRAGRAGRGGEGLLLPGPPSGKPSAAEWTLCPRHSPFTVLLSLPRGSSVFTACCAQGDASLPGLTCGAVSRLLSRLGASSLPPSSSLPAHPVCTVLPVSAPGGLQPHVELPLAESGSRALGLGHLCLFCPRGLGQGEHTVGLSTHWGPSLQLGRSCSTGCGSAACRPPRAGQPRTSALYFLPLPSHVTTRPGFHFSH